MDVDKNWVWIAGSGDLKKVPKCNVKLSIKKNSVIFEKLGGEEENTVERMKMRSMMKKMQEKQDSIGYFS